MRDPDIEFDLEQLSDRYRIAEIIDDSEPQYDFSALFAEHSSDMIGFYIQALQKEDMSPVEKKALYYGVNALCIPPMKGAEPMKILSLHIEGFGKFHDLDISL